MTERFFSRGGGRKPVHAALALILGLSLAAPAFASELPPPPSVKSKLLRDRGDVTIIIIDGDKRRSTSHIGAPSRKQSASRKQAAPPPAPSTRIRRDDDVTIRIKRDRHSGSGHKKARSGPKVIIVDGDSGRCKGGGVCVIRP
ncbi:hypothetical protein PZ897_17880 [Hoeflea sp. YIM 152468]|uniref:hypothetical protein n=1 Tax=Hoeflea sp. YIM 152468 TaxID=3031759 RepID=UPI0023DC28AC|nr:hypothetical protein [Hoeflea sp. YIM 152468]MDF1610054.1 hypothetical protein [Hoeflea sp. YIM 152468]